MYQWFIRQLPNSEDTRLVGGIASILIVGGLWFSGWAAGFSNIATAILWAFSSFAIAYLLGFLFGIPRVLQGDNIQNPAGAGNAASRRYEQRVNTNLEQISDWLTKIFVGLGLVQLGTVPKRLADLAEYLVADCNTCQPAVAACIVVYFLCVGFLTGYLFTRLYIAGAFRRADEQQQEEIFRLLDDLEHLFPKADDDSELRGPELQPARSMANKAPAAAIDQAMDSLLAALRAKTPLPESSSPNELAQSIFGDADKSEKIIKLFDAAEQFKNIPPESISARMAKRFIATVGRAKTMIRNAELP